MNICFATLLAVALVQDGDNWSVRNGHYELSLDAAKSGLITGIAYGPRKFAVHGALICTTDGQKDAFDGRTHEEPRRCAQDAAKGSAKVVRNDASSVVLEFAWSLFDGGRAVETLTFDDTPVVRADVDVEWTKPMGDIVFALSSGYFRTKKTVFYPEARFFEGPYSFGECSMLPRWRYVVAPGASAGLVGSEDGGWSHMNYGVNQGTGFMELHHRYLENEPVPGRTHTDFSLVLTGDRKLGCRLARAAAGTAPKVQLTNIEPDGVFSVEGGKNGLTVTLVNNSASPEKVRVVTELASGLDDVRTVGDETLTLEGEECRVYRKDWTYDRSVQWGVASRVTVYDAETGERLDYRADVTSVKDRAVDAAACGIVNAGQVYKDGEESMWAANLKRGYIGMVEYYCWSPSTWDPSRRLGLAPSVDSWEPVTEAVVYHGPLSKKFVKGFVDACHSRGIHVYTWITGLCNAVLAFEHPEMFQHCANGQLSIYNSGKMRDGGRKFIAKMAPYTEEQARDWGNELADSVDMFGWDGCRWDWGWVPAAPNDPIYLEETLKNPRALEWFNWKGESAFELYKDPDDVAYRCFKAFREAVLRRHPKFVDTTNIIVTPECMAATPKYMDYRCRDGLGLIEYLLNVATLYPKFGTWGKLLARDVQTLRTRGSQCEVGMMRGFNYESSAHLLARSVCNAAGCKWWGANDMRFWGSRYRSSAFAMRFGEWFYGLDLVQVPEAERARKVSVPDGGAFYWNDFVYERRLKDGRRELVVHVVNAGADDYIMPRKLIRRRPVTVKPVLAAGEKSVECWVLAPGDEPTATRLPPQDGAFRFDGLEEAAVFVFRFAK